MAAFEWRLVLTSVLILCCGCYGSIIRVALYIVFFPCTNGRLVLCTFITVMLSLVPCIYITVMLSRWAWRRGYRSIWDIIRPGYHAVENELELYEQWSIESAVRQMIHSTSSSSAYNADASAEQIINDVIRCPSPNCTALWLIPHQYRRCKLKSEQSSLRLILGPGEDRRMSCDKCHAAFCGLCHTSQPSL